MFRTEIAQKISQHKIDLNDPIFTIGSCFADTIGKRLQQFKFNVASNPFGTVYNPLSIHRLLNMALTQTLPPDSTYLEHQTIHNNYLFHSSFAALDKEKLKANIQQSIHSAHDHLQRVKYLLLTYGTAFVYERKDTGDIVANCHKMPAALFTKRMLQQEEIVKDFSILYQQIKKLQPKIKIILTLSPVRHIKDTLELNSVSKAVLRSACHEMVTQFKDAGYFPSFEIMMDDLRDYRFYKSDMLHPTEVAEEYIWEKFTNCYFSQPALSFLNKWSEIQMALAHKAFQPSSSAHQQFLKATLKKLEELNTTVDVNEEMNLIKSQLSE